MAKKLTPTRSFECWVVKHGTYKTVALDALAHVVAKGWQPVTDQGAEFTIKIDDDGTVPTDEYGRPKLVAGAIPDEVPESALARMPLTQAADDDEDDVPVEIEGLDVTPVPGGDTPAGGTPDGAPDVPAGKPGSGRVPNVPAGTTVKEG